MSKKITKTVAEKVLATIDAGLVSGIGNPMPGQMCVEAAVCYALGLPHGDEPGCVSPALRLLKIRLNDSSWSTNEARAKGLRRLGLIQLGSKGALDEAEFTKRMATMVIQKVLPRCLRRVANLITSHSKELEEAANWCEADPSIEAASAANRVAYDAARAADKAAPYGLPGETARSAVRAADKAALAAYEMAYAADKAADAAALAALAALAADKAALAADKAALAANKAARSVADAALAALAADKAALAANKAARSVADAAHLAAHAVADRDTELDFFAEEVVKILVEMEVPGAQWLYLTE